MIINDLYNNKKPVVAEGLDPKKKQRLKDLIDQYRDATDPETYYGLNDEYPDAEEVIAQIRQEFGDRTADSVEQGPSMHYPRPGHSMGYDPMQYKSSPRITKSGVLNKQDVGSMKRDIKQRLKQGMAEGTEEDMPVHRIGLTVIDPQHPMVSKRREEYQKTVRVPGHDREQAITAAINHLRRRGFKVLDHHYMGLLEASLGDYRRKAQLSRAMAQTNKFFDRDDPEAVAQADQTIAKRERGLARADARVKPYTPPAHNVEKVQRDLTAKYPNIDELVAQAEKRRDPNYDYAEGNAYYRGREAEQNYQRLRQIQRVIQGLNESLNQSY